MQIHNILFHFGMLLLFLAVITMSRSVFVVITAVAFIAIVVIVVGIVGMY